MSALAVAAAERTILRRVPEVRRLSDCRHREAREVAEGRVPAEEAMRAKLKRLGLIQREVLDPRDLYVTEKGREVLEASS